MPVQAQFFPGEWTDVDWSPSDGAFVFAYLTQPGDLVLRRAWPDPIHTEQADAIELGRWGLYLRCAADGAGNVCCVAQDGRDRNPATGQFYPAIVVLFPKDGAPREIACPAGPAFGQNAVEVWRDPDDASGWVVYVATAPDVVWMGVLEADGQWGQTDMARVPASSQGFADGHLRMDDVRASVPGMVCPSSADGLSIGQAGEPDRIRGLHQGVYFTALLGAGFEPHLASDGQGRWMGCARTPQGAALFSLAAPFEAEQAPPEPPTPDPERWSLVPEGTLVTGALRVLLGDAPNQQGDIICLNKNTHPEAEWRRIGPSPVHGRLALFHWADASRFTGDPGWWIEPAPVWCFDAFHSGQYHGMSGHIIDLRPGVPPNRWRQTNTLYGTKGGGILVQFDPRFPGQDYGPAKCYERFFNSPTHGARWELWFSPEAARALPWGDRSLDVLKQAVESGPQPPPATPPPFIPCPRPLTGTPPPDPEPEPMPDTKPDLRSIPRDQIVLMADALDGYLKANPRLGLGDGLLPSSPDALPLAITLDATCAYVIGEALSHFQSEGPLPGDAAGYTARRQRALDHAVRVIERERGEQPPIQPPQTGTLRGPISVNQRDFEVPGL